MAKKTVSRPRKNAAKQRCRFEANPGVQSTPAAENKPNAAVPVSVPEPSHQDLLRLFRAEVLRTLGVNDRGRILEHASEQITVELELVAHAVEDGHDGWLAGAVLRQIAKRLDLARELDSGLWDPDAPESTIASEVQS
jgi:hypothetical protein